MANGEPGKRRFLVGIRGRLTFWFVLSAVGAVVVGSIVFYASGAVSIQSTLGHTYCQIASRVVGQIDQHFRSENDFVQNIATDVLTTEVLLEGSQIHRNRPQAWITARHSRLIREWANANSNSKRMALLHTQLSHRLSVMARLNDDSRKRLAVYNIHGILLGASDAPATRHAAGDVWFRAVAGKKKHFTYLDVDRAKNTLTLVIPVWGGVDIVGYVVAQYDHTLLTTETDNVRFGDSGEAFLVDYTGVPLHGDTQSLLIQALAMKPPAGQFLAGQKDRAARPYWIALPQDGDWPLWRRLACVAPAPLINTTRAGFGLAPWSVVVTQSPGESYAALRQSLWSFSLVGIVGILIAGLGGAFIAWHIAAPLGELQDGVRRFARGERDRLVVVSSTDEIGELADEFNRMAERVAASEKELQAFAQAVEDATDAIIMTDPKGEVYYANPACETITGYSREEIRGKMPAFLRTADADYDVFQDALHAAAQGRPWRGEIWNQRKNGETYPVDLSISPIYDDKGEVVSLLGIHRDITLARAYQDELEREVDARTREIAETQGLAVMGRMASMIAHDLRNALSTIKMNLQILGRRHNEALDVNREHCEMGLEQVDYMEEILRDMLSFARPARLRLGWYDVTHILEEALVAMSNLLEGQNVKVVRAGTRGLPKVFCDRVKIIEVLRNLVENALQAMPEGGELTVTTLIMIETSEPMVQIKVRDSGEGIAPDVLPQVFEPFFTTRAKGTGLGLGIVRRIIEQHGGTVAADSQSGEGAVFTFTMPTTPWEQEP